MTSVSRLLAAAALVAAGHAHGAPLKVMLPCERPMLLAGEQATLSPAPQSLPIKPLGTRLHDAFARACGPAWTMRQLPEPTGRLADAQPVIETTLRALRPSVAVFDFPHADLASGVAVDALITRYATLMRVCGEVGAVCLIGGQRPVDTVPARIAARQEEFEQRATATFGDHFLPLYVAFRSEAPRRRAITGLIVGGERPQLTDLGHEVLFTLYRNRLVEITSPSAAHVRGAAPAPQANAAH